jgi:hypothetical protein
METKGIETYEVIVVIDDEREETMRIAIESPRR